MPSDADLYVEPPADCRSPVHEVHELIALHGPAAMLGVFSLHDGRQLFHVRVRGDAAALGEVAAAGAHRPTTTKRRRATRTYQLSGLVRCGLCDRRMQGSWNNGRAHYRCQFAAEYAAVKGIDHPKAVYLREDVITSALDAWLAEVFDKDHLDATCEALSSASATRDDAEVARLEAARRAVDDCERRLAKYRAALDAGADPVVVPAGWLRCRASAWRQRPFSTLTSRRPTR